MKDLFIPYELAVVALEKGFDHYCLAAYKRSDRSLKVMDGTESGHYSEWLSAPLYQQIIDWLREQHQIVVSVNVVDNISGNFYGELTSIGGRFFARETDYGSYYEALNKAIEEALKLI